jgi:hypothetical protein
MRTSHIPSAADVTARLQATTIPHIRLIAKATGIGYQTLIKIRYGTTKDPGIETVRAIWPHLPRVA